MEAVGHPNVTAMVEFYSSDNSEKKKKAFQKSCGCDKKCRRGRKEKAEEVMVVLISPKPMEPSTLQLLRSISLDFITGNEMSEKWESLMKAQVPTHRVIIASHPCQPSLTSFAICSLISHNSSSGSHSFTLLPFNTQTKKKYGLRSDGLGIFPLPFFFV